jgi:hypothetical protein
MNSPFFTLDIPIYGGKVLVCVADEPWVPLKAAKLSTGGRKRKEAALCYAWVDQIEKGFLIPGTEDKARWIVGISLKAGNPRVIELDNDVLLDTVAHECFHLTIYLSNWYGLATDIEHDEAAAYIHGYLVQNIWKFIGEAKANVLF